MMKVQSPNDTLSLAAARKAIIVNLRRLDGETVALEEALFRTPVLPLKAINPEPGYDQSTRDGFAVGLPSSEESAKELRYRIVGEIPAGSVGGRSLQKGTACRIMTGALIPKGAVRIVPQENCKEKDGYAVFPVSAFLAKDLFIRRKGAEIRTGQVVVSSGGTILPGHLALLAATGHSMVKVYRRPRICFFCSGSELVAAPSDLEDGLKISGNRYLVEGLARGAGAVAKYDGTVADSVSALAAAFSRIDPAMTDVIVTTGGVGPGKYDLLEDAFVRAGGSVVYRSLDIRPGASTLFGLLGRTLFFGLPGPPPAVSALFNELVGPALRFMQGGKSNRPTETTGFLQVPLILKSRKPSLRGAKLSIEDGRNMVRPAEKTDVPDGYIFFPGNCRGYEKGALVRVHPIAWSASFF